MRDCHACYGEPPQNRGANQGGRKGYRPDPPTKVGTLCYLGDIAFPLPLRCPGYSVVPELFGENWWTGGVYNFFFSCDSIFNSKAVHNRTCKENAAHNPP